ncbi:MAG TPA: recombinase RecT [Polyangiaceae bacterium]
MAAPQTKPNGEIVPRTEGAIIPAKPGDKMGELIQKMIPELSRALPKHLTGDKLARIALTAIRLNPQLGECTQASFLGCLLSCAMLGLEPNTPLGLAYLIPRKNSKNGGKLECTLQIGYQGMIDLVGNAGVNCFAYAARDGDAFRFQLGMEPNIWHTPSDAADRETKPITHVYAVAVFPDGRRNFTVLTLAQVLARRDRSPAKDSGPWITDFEPMCLKTAVRAHFKWMPKSTEKSTAVARGLALEESHETGTPLLAAMDPAITDILERHGVDVNEITGEVTDG